MSAPTAATAAPPDPFGPRALLEGAWDQIRAHPLPLLLPLVVLGLVSAGQGPYSGANGLTPWWFFPFLLAVALVAALIGLLLLVVQIAVWLVTFEAARLALAGGRAPDLGEGWRSVRWRFTGGRLGPSLSRAWHLTEGHRGDLVLALLVLIAGEIVASIVVGIFPVIGAPLRGVVNGLFGAAWAVTLAVYYHRRLRAIEGMQAP